MKNKLLLNALRCANKERAPVWLMRQAGRYMPQYRKIRKKHALIDMFHDSELAAEVTLLPVRAFGVDGAILFSDILVIPEALGVGLRFEDGVGPIIERPLQSAADVEALPKVDIAHALDYVFKTIKLLRQDLQVPLLGFCGAPFTLASYMIEGGSSRDLKKTKQWMLRDPKSFHRLLDHIADHTITYINLQIKAGAQAIQIFDSWAHFLAHAQFREFSLAYLEKILKGIKKDIPIILFCRGSSIFASQLAELSPAAISLDWNADLAQVRATIPSTIALQGNLDPDILYAPRSLLQKEVKRLLRSMRGNPGYVFNLGHGIAPDVSPEAVQVLVETVQGF
jgi:uroporphyrinogen decarboxylase